MSGIVSSMADHLTLNNVELNCLQAGRLAVVRLHGTGPQFSCADQLGASGGLQSEFAFPALVLEAILLICFGLLRQSPRAKVCLLPLTVMLLCFIMGLQRRHHHDCRKPESATHITGLVTDMGIELGKLLYWNISEMPPTPCT